MNATKNIYKSISVSKDKLVPAEFIFCLRKRFPDFNQKDNKGNYYQQDAEECCSSMLNSLGNGIKQATGGNNIIDDLFSFNMEIILERENEKKINIENWKKLNCYIDNESKIQVNHINDGINIALSKT